MTYQLRLLGRLRLTSPEGDDIVVPSKKNQVLLAILALAGGGAVAREKLIGILWAERGEEQARASLRQGFTALRKAFAACGPMPLRVDDEAAALDLGTVTVDAVTFMEDSVSHSPETLERVLALWRGELLEGLTIPDQAVQDWLSEARRSLAARHHESLARLLAIHEEMDDQQAALATARHLLAEDPVNEAAHRAVMRGHARAGERGRALKQYQTCREALARDLGVSPEPATEDLLRQIAGGSLAPGPQEAPGEPGLFAALEPAGPSPERPSIAVLPFTNLSGDPGHEYFADGITDNITTELSRFRDLFVIARDSSHTFKGKGVTVQEACRSLGVRYALEGSVQRAADRIRIAVQLIDGESGRQLWVERYDRQLDDVFVLQDEVTGTIVATLAAGYGGRLRKAWQNRPETRHPGNVKSFDCFLRAMDLFNRFTKESVAEAKPYFEEAIRLDPSYAKAHSKLSWAHMVEASERWSDDYEGSMAKGHESALAAIAADDNESWGHWSLAGYYALTMRHDLAIATFERALALNPNDADVLTDVGMFLSYAGRAEEGIAAAKKAMQLNPYHPEWYQMQFVQICFDARRYQEAVEAFESLSSIEGTTLTALYVAASHAALGAGEKAKAEVDRALALDPTSTVSKWTQVEFAPYKEPADLAHFRDNLVKAGLPA